MVGRASILLLSLERETGQQGGLWEVTNDGEEQQASSDVKRDNDAGEGTMRRCPETALIEC